MTDDRDDEDSGVQPTVTLHEHFWSREGYCLTAEEFQVQHPKRELVKLTDVLGVAVSTEFVGINHNTDPDGAPHIFETLVAIDGYEITSGWTSNEADSERRHAVAVASVWVWAPAWHVRQWCRRMRHRMFGGV